MIVFTVTIEKHEDLNAESQHDESQRPQEEEKCKETGCFVFGLFKNVRNNPLKSLSKCWEVLYQNSLDI